MRQQVNLYQPIFRKQRRVFSARAMFTAAAAVMAGLMAVHGYGVWQLSVLRTEVAGLAAQRNAAQQRLVELEQRLPLRRKSRLLESEIVRIQSQIN